jgi:murein L,D-transpeptidase YcbB/YkuD
MTAAHRGDLVTRLVAGVTQPVQCLCYLDYTSMPTLRPGMDVGARAGIYVRALQKVLETMSLNDARHETGLYDEQTVAQVKRLQRVNGLAPNGVVDASTWHTVLGKGCKLYRS